MVVALVCADLHFEPWYDPEQERDDRRDEIRTRSASKQNMSRYIGSMEVPQKCDSDPPLYVLDKVIKDFFDKNQKPGKIFMFGGDTLSHSVNPTVEEQTLFMNETLKIIRKYFEAKDIFYVPGNHDGTTDRIFQTDNSVDKAWAQALIDNDIIDKSQHDNLLSCGFYVKEIKGHRALINKPTSIICINSILSNYKPATDGTGTVCFTNQRAWLKEVMKPNMSYIGLMHYPAYYLLDGIDLSKLKVFFTAHTHRKDYIRKDYNDVRNYNIPPITMYDKPVMYYLSFEVQSIFDKDIILDIHEVNCDYSLSRHKTFERKKKYVS